MGGLGSGLGSGPGGSPQTPDPTANAPHIEGSEGGSGGSAAAAASGASSPPAAASDESQRYLTVTRAALLGTSKSRGALRLRGTARTRHPLSHDCSAHARALVPVPRSSG